MRESHEFDTFARHICVEHQRLNRLLLEARHRIDAWRAAGTTQAPENVVAQLEAIEHELRQHFAEEEAEGCLEEAVAQMPSLAPEESRLLREHAGLLERIAQLRNIVVKSNETGWQMQDFVDEFQAICNCLETHEEAESRMMHQAFPASLDIENESAVH